MSFPPDNSNQKTDGWKAENLVSKLSQVNCLICDLGNDWQASEPAEDLKPIFEAAKTPSHKCGNYEHDCPIFQAFKLRLMTPIKVYCPFCKLLNDGQCSHFDTSSGYGPAIKVCRRCNTFGEHWSNNCPNVVRNGPLPPLMYCKICQSSEHWSPQCPNAEASLYERTDS